MNFLSKLISFFKNSFSKFDRGSYEEKFESLTPIDDISEVDDEKQGYIRSLNWALEQEDINNIALAGPLGAGKSSVLKTHKKINEDYNYLEISLASFNNNSEIIEDEPDKDDNYEKLVEENILQQIFYKESKNAIPNSRLERITNIEFWDVLPKVLIFLIWLGWIAWYFNVELVNSILISPIINLGRGMIGFLRGIITFPSFFEESAVYLSELLLTQVDLIRNLLFVLVTGRIITDIILYLLRELNFNKISFLKNEIELKSDIEGSILNKYLDEILYFFEATDYDIVVIEDLDRFENIKFFTKLRELNYFINNAKKVSQDVNFIYAVKNDIFKKKERTKFFDFIIPIIPVVNSSNSKEILKDKLSNFINNGETSISENFINRIGSFIDDMRMLVNICNEFIIYEKKLSITDLEKLFSIIAYKNIHPADFLKLQDDYGMIPEVFNKKEKITNHKIKEIESEIKGKKEKIKHIDNESLCNLKELHQLYLENIREEINETNNKKYIRYIEANGEKYNYISNLREEENFKNLLEANKIKCSFKRGFCRFTFDEIENRIENNNTYEERKKLIKQKHNRKIKELRTNIKNLKEEKNKIASYSLKKFIDEFGKEEVFDGEIIDEELPRFLLINGYIDERYQSYLTYFYPGSMREEDRDFVNKVKSRMDLNYNYELKKKEEIMKNLNIDDFDGYKGILNYNLLDFIIENIEKDDYELYYNEMISQLINNKMFDFINSYIERKEANKEYFMCSLCHKWKNLWEEVKFNSEVSEQKYLRNIIKFADNIEDIKRMNKKNLLKDYISQDESFLEFVASEELLERAEKLIKELEIKFEKLISPRTETEKELFNFIYKNNFYAINSSTLDVIVRTKAEIKNKILEQFEIVSYTVLNIINCKPLFNYIDNNINEYIENVLLNTSINEEEDMIEKLLNKDSVKKNNKVKIIEKMETSISDITKIKDLDIQGEIIRNSKFETNWTNLFNYYLKVGKIDDKIAGLLTQNKQIFNVKFNKDKIEKNQKAKEFFKNLIESSKIEEEIIKKLAFIPYRYDELNFSSLSSDSIDTIVDNDLLNLTNKNIDSLEKTNDLEDKHIDLIIKNIETYLKNTKEYKLDARDIKLLLTSSELKLEEKLLIIDNIDTNILSRDKQLINSIYNVLLKTKDELKLDSNLINYLLEFEKDIKKKVNILIKQIPNSSIKKTINFLNKLGKPYSKIVKEKRPTLKKTSYNKELMKVLQKKNVVGKCPDEGKNKFRVYPKSGTISDNQN